MYYEEAAGCKGVSSRLTAAFLLLLCAWGAARAQAPPAIRIFMPNGDRLSRELRLQLTRDDGRIETVFTDSKASEVIQNHARLSDNNSYPVIYPKIILISLIKSFSFDYYSRLH
jgi:hypothetical protein